MMSRPSVSRKPPRQKYKAAFIVLMILGSFRVEARRGAGIIQGLFFFFFCNDIYNCRNADITIQKKNIYINI